MVASLELVRCLEGVYDKSSSISTQSKNIINTLRSSQNFHLLDCPASTSRLDKYIFNEPPTRLQSPKPFRIQHVYHRLKFAQVQVVRFLNKMRKR